MATCEIKLLLQRPKRVETLRLLMEGIGRAPHRVLEVSEELDGGTVTVENEALTVMLPDGLKLVVSFLPEGNGIIASATAPTASEAKNLADISVRGLASIAMGPNWKGRQVGSGIED